ncbi:MAG: PPC domain-containing protein [Kofleriaceae bacterium]|nr:PPC domain-containing protein [Kofleriaceae bacterium]
MVRECLAGLALLSLGGCSLVLDFSDEQVPKDAYDLPYTQEQCDLKEPNDTLETAALLSAGEVTSAAICIRDPADRDFYKFTVTADATNVVISVTFPESTAGDLDLKLYDAVGSVLAQSRGFATTESLTCPTSACNALAPGDYVFEVFPALATGFNAYEASVNIAVP